MPTATPVPTPTPPPVSADPVLASLLAVTTFRGLWNAVNVYQTGEVVTGPDGAIYLAAFAGTSATLPGSQWRQLPLLSAIDTVIGDDGFDGDGPLIGRSANGSAWTVYAAGREAAATTSSYVSSAGNTYMILGPFARPITEVSVWSQYSPGTAPFCTISLSDRPPETLFGSMWHVNWTDSLLGIASYWDDSAGVFGVNAPGLWDFNRSGLGLPRDGSEYLMTMRMRGAFVFGYLGDTLGFIQVSDVAAWIAGRAISFYIQNHQNTFGVERYTRVEVRG